ncbi:coiled-coil domain-containing protein 55-domain containing protein [Coniella lustricola]|uniref:Coiled-coil domain-containing protein 55-domain containing protein n=1 Tax=Coniella lustricola TaxID=2025994 RepID=A0A2T3AEU3_9PEZI|nr:coiled-coil domain-containing protein 55-domain containing protein [Coniella lustricola]
MSSKPTLSFGLSLNKKKTGLAEAQPPKRKTAFGVIGSASDGDSDDETPQQASRPAAAAASTSNKKETITELDGFSQFTSTSTSTSEATADSSRRKHGKLGKGAPPPPPPTLKSKNDPTRQFGDLSSALTSRKYAQAAETLDPSVYDYDAAYDVLKAVEKQREAEVKKESAQRKSRYMADVTKAAEQRERDRSVAELKKIQREREAEGDEFADKEKFVTEAYKRKQEEDKLAEEQEKRREEEERKKNKFGGMTGFHKELLEREDQKRLELEKMAAEAATSGRLPAALESEKEKVDTDIAKELNAKGGKVAVNEDGEVVDKRELLRGGLNLGAKKKQEPKETIQFTSSSRSKDQSTKAYLGSGGKQAMRDRQTRMMEAQLEESLKRAREEEDEERKKVEQAAKSQKTTTDISSAKERYLARKRAAEEAKKNGQVPP